MKKAAFLLLILSFAALSVFAQKRKATAKPTTKKAATKQVAAKQTAAPAMEIPTKDWDALTDALSKENWTQAANLSALALGKLKTDNDKKQLAQLRYFYVYATAGKFAEGKIAYAELEKTAKNFIGEKFMMPNRTILADCADKLNYICAAKNSNQVLRITATDKVANIHSLEYVKLAENFDTAANAGKDASLVGDLENVETFSSKTGAKFLRLIFAAGAINVVP